MTADATRICLCRAVLTAAMAFCVFTPRIAHAINTNWIGGTSDEISDAANWTAGVPGANDTAIFGAVGPAASTTPVIEAGDEIEASSFFFAASAPAYHLTIEMGADGSPGPDFPSSLTLSGSGITNSSGDLQTFTVQAGFAPLPVNPNTAWPGGRLVFTNAATVSAGAGVVIILETPQVVGAGATTAARFTMLDASSAGNATIQVLADHNGTADGGASVQFMETSHAGSAQISTEAGYNDGGRVLFFDNSSAASAAITNEAGFPDGGFTAFEEDSIAGFATITNEGSTSSIDGSGRTFFRGNSSALGATIANNGGLGTGHGGTTTFEGNSTAGNAAITSIGGVLGGSGGSLLFTEDADAASATILANGSLLGGGGGSVVFTGNASGANAGFVTSAGTSGGNGSVDFSGISAFGTTAGSIAGSGDYLLGSKQLIVGSNNTNTTVSGSVSGTGGSLRKVGTGTMTLSGNNTFSGDFVLTSGRVNVNSTTALGTGVTFVFGGTVGSTLASSSFANPVSVNADFNVAPANNAAAVLNFAGPVNLGAVTRTLAGMTIGATEFSNGIVGAGGITLEPDGFVATSFAFSGTAPNTYGGDTTVQGNGAGGTTTLRLSKPAGTNAVPGNLAIGLGGSVVLAESNQIADASAVTVSSGGTLDLNGFSEQIRTLQGSGSVMLDDAATAGDIHVGNGNFSGVISDGGLGGRLFKNGPAALVLSGPSSYSGITSVDGGTLIAANAGGSATGSSQVTVKPGGTLAGGNATATAGFIAGPVSVADNGRIAPGMSFGIAGKLTLGDKLTLSDGSILHLQLRAANDFAALDNDLIDVGGALVLDGILDIDDSPGFGGLGDYLLIAYAGTLADNGLKIGALPSAFSLAQFKIDVSQPGLVILHVVPESRTAVLALLSLWIAVGLCREKGSELFSQYRK